MGPDQNRGRDAKPVGYIITELTDRSVQTIFHNVQRSRGRCWSVIPAFGQPSRANTPGVAARQAR